MVNPGHWEGRLWNRGEVGRHFRRRVMTMVRMSDIPPADNIGRGIYMADVLTGNCVWCHS